LVRSILKDLCIKPLGIKYIIEIRSWLSLTEITLFKESTFSKRTNICLSLSFNSSFKSFSTFKTTSFIFLKSSF